jgi:pimeloyl-ACP methyl ester carboxylesterase
MDTVQSKDGTAIAFESRGQGQPVVLVDGALCSRKFGPMEAMAERLASKFRAITYDRRGRGDSGDTAPYAIDREIDDIQALIRAVGGSALLFGVSSGAALALEAANRGIGVTKLALYEAPFIVDDTRTPIPSDYLAKLQAFVDTGRRADAVRMFMRLVGVPGFFIFIMRFMPAWSKLTAVAHTLPYDIAIVGPNQTGRPLPNGHWDAVTMPTLVLDGGKSPAWMRNGMKQLAGRLPNADYMTLPGQTHMVKAEVLAPVLIDFFGC